MLAEQKNTSSAQGRFLILSVATSSLGRVTVTADAASPRVGQSPTLLKSLAWKQVRLVKFTSLFPEFDGEGESADIYSLIGR